MKRKLLFCVVLFTLSSSYSMEEVEELVELNDSDEENKKASKANNAHQWSRFGDQESLTPAQLEQFKTTGHSEDKYKRLTKCLNGLESFAKGSVKAFFELLPYYLAIQGMMIGASSLDNTECPPIGFNSAKLLILSGWGALTTKASYDAVRLVLLIHNRSN